MDIYQRDGMEKKTRVPRETPQQPIWTISKSQNNQSELSVNPWNHQSEQSVTPTTTSLNYQ